jgi:hypothetical protein
MGDSLDWTPGQACRDAGKECDKDDADAAFCIILNRGPKQDRYGVSYRNSGLSASEVIALLDIMRHKIMVEDIFPPPEQPEF